MAQFPQFAVKPGVGPHYISRILMMSPTTKHPDEVLKVLSTIVSDEIQLDLVENQGLIAVVRGKQFQQNYGKNIDILKGKNVAAIYKMRPAEPVASEQNGYAIQQVNALVINMMKNHLDVNTASRQYDEIMAKFIQEQSQQ